MRELCIGYLLCRSFGELNRQIDASLRDDNDRQTGLSVPGVDARWTLAPNRHMFTLAVRGPGPARNTASDAIMAKMEIELPEATVKAASDAGLLAPRALDRLLTDAIKRRQAADSLLSIADRAAAADVEPMSMEEIDAEVKAARADRRQRTGGH